MTTEAFTVANASAAYTLTGGERFKVYGNGNTNIPGLTASKVVVTDANKNLASATQTGTGTTVVMATSPTIATPIITTSAVIPLIKPAADSTTALKITKADGTTLIVTFDTENAIVKLGQNGDTSTATSPSLTLQGYNCTAGGTLAYGNYGGLILNCNSSLTSSAKKFLITNSLNTNSFGVIRSVDAATFPSIGDTGTITSGTADFVIDTNGKIGIGTTTPTARLHLPAGSATANTAPLQFTSGNLETTARAGVVEYNNQFYITDSAAERRAIASSLDTSITADTTKTVEGYITLNIGGTNYKVMVTN